MRKGERGELMTEKGVEHFVPHFLPSKEILSLSYTPR